MTSQNITKTKCIVVILFICCRYLLELKMAPTTEDGEDQPRVLSAIQDLDVKLLPSDRHSPSIRCPAIKSDSHKDWKNQSKSLQRQDRGAIRMGLIGSGEPINF